MLYTLKTGLTIVNKTFHKWMILLYYNYKTIALRMNSELIAWDETGHP